MPPPKRFLLKEFYQKGEIRSRHQEEEFGPGRRDVLICPEQDAVYHKKSWHHFSRFFTKPLRREKQFRFKFCPVHELLLHRQFEGEVVITGLPSPFRREALNLIENIGAEAYRRDVLDRVLGVVSRGDTVRVTTSENQTAKRIAAKLAARFKKRTNVKIHRGRNGEVMRVTVAFTS